MLLQRALGFIQRVLDKVLSKVKLKNSICIEILVNIFKFDKFLLKSKYPYEF